MIVEDCSLYYGGVDHKDVGDAMLHVNADVMRHEGTITQTTQGVNRLESRLVNYEDNNARVDAQIAMHEALIEQLKERMSHTISYIHQCKCCNATLKVPENNGVFYCQSCGACYVLDSAQIKCTY